MAYLRLNRTPDRIRLASTALFDMFNLRAITELLIANFKIACKPPIFINYST
jgi:hypothetical protein